VPADRAPAFFPAASHRQDDPGAPDVVKVPVGAFADPSFPAPTVSIYESRRHPWLALPAAMEHHD
jgi:hypothetical protein